MSAPSVYTIPPGAPFVDVLATGIRALAGDKPEHLTRCTVLLPTRRARRSLQEAFLRQSAGQALLLPRLMTLGDLDEDELALSGPWDDTQPTGLQGGHELPPAISPTRRRFLLAQLIMARGDQDITPDQASWLAAELAKLLDHVQRERLGFDNLSELVPDHFADHWKITLTFLEYLTKFWPDILAEEGYIDQAERTNRLLDAQADLWRQNPPKSLVIAAGSTGTIPATADLLKVIANLPKGMVILPGFDTEAGTDAWQAMGTTHPQSAMVQLLDHLEIDPSSVTAWPYGIDKNAPVDRVPLVREALRPAGVDQTGDDAHHISKRSLKGLTWIDCPTPQEEAGAIALVMRQTLETPGKTAALITPDRALGRRVVAALKRWGIDVDDSSGIPLAQSPPGTFLRLTADMIAERLAPVSLLAALKHPFAAGGQAPGQFRQNVRRLEHQILRGPRPAAGFDGLRAALKNKKNTKTTEQLLDDLEDICSKFIEVFLKNDLSLRELVRLHVDMAERLAASDTESGAQRLWAKDAGETAATFIAELAEESDALGTIAGHQYPALFNAMIAGKVVRPRFGLHPRLYIWGLLEARLQRADVMILGGLNEGTWPPEAIASPWMSRPMLRDFGLPAPERHIGLTAHDFTQAFGAPNVVLTRAARVDGTPTVPSRWLLQLQNLIEAAGLTNEIEKGEHWLDWQNRIDETDAPKSVNPPEPRPPVSARPRQISVSRVETWIRDPYAIYAQDVLKLKPLDALAADPDARERGIIIHDILDEFVSTHPNDLPDNAHQILIDMGARTFARYSAWPNIHAFWWPRFEVIADWFITFEKDRRTAGYQLIAAETEGELSLDGPGGAFVLTARADRIDLSPKQAWSILDYKTGQMPSWKQVESMLAPQLPLEAAIANAGGFKIEADNNVEELVFVQLSGGRTPAKLSIYKGDTHALTEKTVRGLQKRIAEFDQATTPYRARVRPMFVHRAGEFDHLARVKEWIGGKGEIE